MIRPLRRWTLFILLMALWPGLCIEPVRAEGNVFFGGYGYDHAGCGAGLLPCGSYGYARLQACNLSENAQDTYHVFHVYDGYISSCDMVGGTGREQQGWIERDWPALWQSTLPPMLVIALFTSLISWLYHRRLRFLPPKEH
jgi:hypothetical protein